MSAQPPPERPTRTRESKVTTAVDDLFQQDPLAHFVPIQHCELELFQIEIEIFSFPPVIRYNPLSLIYRTIQGLLENMETN